MIRAGFLLAGLAAAPALAAECDTIAFDDAEYVVCTVLAEEDLRMFLRDEEGQLLGSFAAIEDVTGNTLSFAMNAGMFHPDRAPVGLYIEGDRQEATLSDGGGYGNFGLLPNGVFCIGDTLNVYDRETFAAESPDCNYASQSGPMLVIDGAIHPRFLPDSDSRFIRNGVGTAEDGSYAVFAISNDPVTFYDFARLFRDRLGVPQALFFDAKVSRLYAPQVGRNDGGFPLGPIVGVVDPEAEAR